MDKESQIYDILSSLKSNLCYVDEKTYKNICIVLDCVLQLLEG